MPLGLFCHGEFPTRRWKLAEGDTLFLYTDGLSEARDAQRREYGLERLAGWLSGRRSLAAEALLSDARAEVGRFRAGAAPTDDQTLMAIRRTTP
jgi:sigma-B regulation protein RsbU (phosphoserine phosphatase)